MVSQEATETHGRTRTHTDDKDWTGGSVAINPRAL